MLQRLFDLHRDLAVDRAREVGLLNPADPFPASGYTRDHVVGIDGKVFDSPLRTLDIEPVDRASGLIRPVRQDPARQRYGEAGTNGLVWGTKFAIASVRSPLANHRVILGITHFPADTPGGEGRVFTGLPVDLAARSPGIHAFTADGAWRGTHLNHVQTGTGSTLRPRLGVCMPHAGGRSRSRRSRFTRRAAFASRLRRHRRAPGEQAPAGIGPGSTPQPSR